MSAGWEGRGQGKGKGKGKIRPEYGRGQAPADRLKFTSCPWSTRRKMPSAQTSAWEMHYGSAALGARLRSLARYHVLVTGGGCDGCLACSLVRVPLALGLTNSSDGQIPTTIDDAPHISHPPSPTIQQPRQPNATTAPAQGPRPIARRSPWPRSVVQCPRPLSALPLANTTVAIPLIYRATTTIWRAVPRLCLHRRPRDPLSD